MDMARPNGAFFKLLGVNTLTDATLSDALNRQILTWQKPRNLMRFNLAAILRP